MSFVPRSFVQDRWLGTLGRTARGSIAFVGPDGNEWAFAGGEPGPDVRFQIHDWSVIERAAARGDIGLGEDFIAGAWQTPDLEALITFFLLNMDALDDFANGNLLNRAAFTVLNTLVRRNSLAGSRRNIEAHYDVGNDFYALWLDETMTYSSALYGAGDTLADAQRRKYARILSKLGGASSVLEIGCGWGGFAEQAADAGHDVTGLTISPSQHRFAAARLGGRADIRLEDYRNSSGRFDAIVSIEMMEAVGERYWPQYFNTLAARIKDGGRAVIQTITMRDDIFALYRRRSDFIRHYVFPGGMLPSLTRIGEEAARAGLAVREVHSFGLDYARTLRAWSERLRGQETAIRALGHDDRFMRNWEFYLGICAAAFSVGRTDVVQLELAHA